MKRTLLFFLLSTLFLAMVVMTSVVALATIAPLQVGQPGYPLQEASEQSVAALTPVGWGKAAYLLTLLERRTADLDSSLGNEQEISALDAVTAALKQGILGVAQAPAADWPALRTRLLKDIQWMQVVLAKFHTPGAAALSAWLPGLETAVNDLNQTPEQMLALLAPQDPTAQAGVAAAAARKAALRAAAPHVVQFQPGTAGAVHAFFPLDGQHASIECQACHQEGRYAGTPPECRACHGKDEPKDHYPAECSLCHTTTAWKPATFEHAALDTGNCESCHNGDRPENHYPGQCSACHETNAWKPAHFDHAAAAATDCQSCHNRPNGHWKGQCSACHSTNAWKPARFNHAVAGATDCQSCHNRPSGHFGGQCSACHSTNAWRPARFDHGAAGATDCQSCHKRPSGHFSGQCSACHSTSKWGGARFDHGAAGATDCQSCHNRPRNHFDGQCSDCHSTKSWSGASFKHEFDQNHGGAGGQCALCHPNGTDSTDCSACHKDPGGGKDDD
jgi:hypothetical protein